MLVAAPQPSNTMRHGFQFQLPHGAIPQNLVTLLLLLGVWYVCATALSH